MTTFVLSLGSNCGNRRQNIEDALTILSGMLSDFKASSIYETQALGGGDSYLNAVASGKSQQDVTSLNALCKRMEKEAGRDETARRLKRVPLDIDIVMANEEVLRPHDFSCHHFRLGYTELTGMPENNIRETI